MFATVKRLLIGTPIASSEEHHQRLSKKVALPVFASDAISSTAYATDEILGVLLLQAGVGASPSPSWSRSRSSSSCCSPSSSRATARRSTPTRAAAAATSSRRENLGTIPALVAGSSLLVDYILTVAVSVAGGVLAIRSATGLSSSWAVPLCLACIVVMTLANLRGVKESGAVFAPPTYIYVTLLLLLIGVGLYKVYVKDLRPDPELAARHGGTPAARRERRR